MARGSRFTVRLADLEIQSIKKFAEENHVLTSWAVRWLIAVGLASETHRPQDVRQTQISTRPLQLADERDLAGQAMAPSRNIGEDCS
jgi:hypothetical protein